ncbi:glycosyltransferase [Marivirga sp. S37H4]|uniref:Glycosyltransferase n=1 Tax=Marivirga aurantiaca TaxID=2802615 RepID=A0A934WXD3_9BACT|nr:glycosyltransferase [Marivirga aurantiaca]MBK6264560.1 glycosyltransferase [Marivirga aurantiaca]
MSKKILFVCPYPFDEAPSQRFRFEQYFPVLKEKGFQYKIAPFLSPKAWAVLYQKGNKLKKVTSIFFSFMKRSALLFQLKPYDFIFIHREASPVGPPFFEWAVRFLWRKKIIYDFDDAIWLDDPNEAGSLKSRIKWKKKVKSICKWSYKVSCGNQYLADFASKFNAMVVVNPTTIDSENLHMVQNKLPQTDKKTPPIIGWTGTHSTLHYLNDVIPILEKLETQYDFKFLVIANKRPDFSLKSLIYIPWNKATEIKDLNQMDIGIMPLTDDIWSKGKCGFKALQYMALAKPVVASPVGVNQHIIENGRSGYLAVTEAEWETALTTLLTQENRRIEMGLNGLQKVRKHYTVNSNSNNFLSLFS